MRSLLIHHRTAKIKAQNQLNYITMFKIIHFIGSLFIFIWLATMFMGTDVTKLVPMPYGELLLKYKWLILIAGVLFSAYGFTHDFKQRPKNHRDKEDSGNNQITKKNYIAEQQQYRSIKQIDEIIRNKPELKDLALKVDWTPLNGGGANFKTKKLVRIDDSRIEILHSTGGRLFSVFFILMGSIIPGVIAFSMFKDKGFEWAMLFPLFIGSLFVGVGGAMLIYPKPRVFDKRKGWFWAGNKGLQREQEFIGLKKSARLSEIAAIQVIAERMSSSKAGSYTSWEINLVSKDAQRLNVLDHGHKQSISKDAQMLGEFLDVPVWENI